MLTTVTVILQCINHNADCRPTVWPPSVPSRSLPEIPPSRFPIVLRVPPLMGKSVCVSLWFVSAGFLCIRYVRLSVFGLVQWSTAKVSLGHNFFFGFCGFNRPFPSCYESYYENQAKCKGFYKKISFVCI